MHLRWCKFVPIRKKLRNISRILLVVFSFLAVLLIFDPQKRVTKFLSMKYSSRLPKTELKILLWPPDVAERLQIIQLIEKQIQEDCPRHDSEKEIPPKCAFTADIEILNDVDAILDFVVNLKTPLPPASNFSKTNPIRIFYQLEVPLHFGKKPPKLPSEYNWTFTYRRDSDLATPFGLYEPLSASNGILTDIQESHNSPIEIPWEELPSYKSKTYSPTTKHHLVAWMASNCGPTQSRREDLVQHLQKFLPVHIYGKCGPLNCSQPLTPDGSTIYDCYEELGQEHQYKFYLSFETALCVDYVTEKLFGALKNNMVPIVYGSAIYSHFAPPGSYINARDFLTVESLANYIKYLDQHPQEYQKYFKWKEKYRIRHARAWCELCDKLWDISILNEHGDRVIDPNYRKVQKDTAKWWFYDRHGIEKKKPACGSPPKFTYNKLNPSKRKRRKT